VTTVRPTLLCGAGISTAAGLPDGQQLAQRVLEEVWSGSRIFGATPPDRVSKALEWRAGHEPDLRLELVLELLSHHLETQTLVEAFRGLNGAIAARAHAVLALAPIWRLVTTNQDVLLEQAIACAGRKRAVLHLHGDCRQPRYISTLISQYVVGLKRSVSEQFKSAVTGRHVVVVGYSGRDRDVLPYLYAAEKVTWLHYEPAGSSRAVASELRTLLEARAGRVSLVRHPEPIAVLLPTLSRSALAVLSRVDQSLATRRLRGSWTWDLPREVVERYRSFDPVRRDLALARVLVRVGDNDFALEGLRVLEKRRSRFAPQVHQMLGNLFFTTDPEQALHHYRLAARSSRHPASRAAAELAIANLKSNQSAYATARRALDRAATAASEISGARQRARVVARILARSARMHVMSDDETASLREYRRMRQAARRAGDIDTLVEGLTFGSDPLRSRGRYREALELCEEAMSDAELYARPGALQWAHFYRGMCWASMYELTRGLADLDRARQLAETAGEQQLLAWALASQATWLRAIDLDAAMSAATDARKAMRRYRAPLFALRVRLDWEEAELARAEGDFGLALKRLRRLEARVSRSSERMPYLDAHAAALRGEIARDTHDPSARKLIRDALRLYRAGRWAHGEVRMQVSLWLMGDAIQQDRLLARCRTARFGQEAALLASGRRTGYVPLHVY